MAVITLPKQTPRNPSAPGRPKVRTANSFFCGKISTVTGPGIEASYFSVESLPRLAKQGQNPRPEEVGLARVHPDDEAVIGQGSESGEAVAESDEVEGEDVIAVLRKDLGGQLPALLLPAEPEQVLAELDAGGQVIGVDLQRLPLIG